MNRDVYSRAGRYFLSERSQVRILPGAQGFPGKTRRSERQHACSHGVYYPVTARSPLQQQLQTGFALVAALFAALATGCASPAPRAPDAGLPAAVAQLPPAPTVQAAARPLPELPDGPDLCAGRGWVAP